MTTLHSYILRELLKVFLLATGALTALFTMGGGLFNMLKFEGLNASDLAPHTPLLMLVACGITMPVAALFATTMVYGRLAADNEFVACRAAGINVLRLFLAAMLLSVFVALFTFVATDLIVPTLGRQMVEMATGNLHRLAEKRLRETGYARINLSATSELLLTADDVQTEFSAAELQKAGHEVAPGLDYMWLARPTFMIIGADGAFERCTSSEQGLCTFDHREPPLKVTVALRDLRDLDRGTSAIELADQQFGPIPIPFETSLPAIAASITQLVEWKDQPWTGERLPAELAEFRDKLRRTLLMQWVVYRMRNDGRLELPAPDDGVATLSGDAVAEGPRGPTIERAQLEIRDKSGALRSAYSAATADVRVAASSQDGRLISMRSQSPQAAVMIELKGNNLEAAVRDTLRDDGSFARREDDHFEVTDLGYPQAVLTETAAFTDVRIVDEIEKFPIASLEEDHHKLQRRAEKLRRKAIGQIHTRLSYAVSSFATIPLAAALGLIFRGSRALTAFGLACIPFGAVMLVVLTGKQMTDSAGSHAIGPYVIWGGIAAAAIATMIILWRGVQR
ncbi:MAG: LptF/LptG family permease [Phycisphaerales bacterium]|nr:LptF/LptG family permease [Phycisphaerales bacterium]